MIQYEYHEEIPKCAIECSHPLLHHITKAVRMVITEYELVGRREEVLHAHTGEERT